MSYFEDTLQRVVALAFFMPMIAGMTGNTGTQSLAVVIRGLSKEELNKKTIFRLIFRELRTGIIIGLVCAVFITGIAIVWQGNFFARICRRNIAVCNAYHRNDGGNDRADHSAQMQSRPCDRIGSADHYAE